VHPHYHTLDMRLSLHVLVETRAALSAVDIPVHVKEAVRMRSRSLRFMRAYFLLAC